MRGGDTRLGARAPPASVSCDGLGGSRRVGDLLGTRGHAYLLGSTAPDPDVHHPVVDLNRRGRKVNQGD